MKVISLLQPWATLVVMGAKRIETRSWNTKYRGNILIHASAGKNKINNALTLDFQQEFFKLNIPAYKNLPFGAIIGQSNLEWTQTSEILKERLSEKLNLLIEHIGHSGQQELVFGDYAERRYGWMLNDTIQFQRPIPCKGSLSIWNLPQELEIEVLTQRL